MFSAITIGALAWKIVRLPIYCAFAVVEPFLRVGMTMIAVLGIISAGVLRFSGSAPDFPFWDALVFFSCCGGYPILHRALLRLLAP
jgi:hypothetical protein